MDYGWLHYYNGYVDDIFAVFESKDHAAVSFYNYISRQQSNIKFTVKLKKNNKLLSLDILVWNKPNLVSTAHGKVLIMI